MACPRVEVSLEGVDPSTVTRAARRPPRYLLLAFVALAWAVSPSVASAASTFYVATNGSDTNSGTYSEPWRTPQHAVDMMAPGDTTYVLAGTYASRTSCDTGDGGSATGGYVSLRAYPGSRPVLTGAFDGIVTIRCDYFELKGFDIAGPGVVGGTNIYPTGSSDHVRILQNDVHGSICQGISMNPNTADYEIVGNRIHHNGVSSPACDQQAHGLYLQGDRHRVENNLIYDNHDYGIQAYPYGRDSTIAYNASSTTPNPGS